MSKRAVTKTLPLNFLLGCSNSALGNYELARLAEVAELRNQIQLRFFGVKSFGSRADSIVFLLPTIQ